MSEKSELLTRAEPFRHSPSKTAVPYKTHHRGNIKKKWFAILSDNFSTFYSV